MFELVQFIFFQVKGQEKKQAEVSIKGKEEVSVSFPRVSDALAQEGIRTGQA